MVDPEIINSFVHVIKTEHFAGLKLAHMDVSFGGNSILRSRGWDETEPSPVSAPQNHVCFEEN